LALNVSYEGFGALTGFLQQLAEQHCDGRLVFVLEGGYNLESLSNGTRAVLAVLAGNTVPVPDTCGIAEVQAAADFHRTAFQSE
jgi:acetoin utilization deacetylase AcuC-like enzyme